MMALSPYVLLINPNGSEATTGMMLNIARRTAAGRLQLEAATADRSPPMITNEPQLIASAAQVIEIGINHASACAGVIVSAYGDPGVTHLQDKLSVPVIGICEASMITAAGRDRKFGVATVTPDLADAIAARADSLGLTQLYTGIRCTLGDPQKLASNNDQLCEELEKAVNLCVLDGAQAVIIGGGPLGEAAEYLRSRFEIPIIAPISSAVELMISALDL
ncbi:aspartate/glutamate racemase family protein [Brucella pituitosa]|uniref:Aspartate/glutamate racemase family protein n=1 Tax=Brucella pituitosa TaxID=571256 RepID=A0A643EY56_9HYPH|nr:aspartate/glutamate racemase family protein [Brucella pituitosa]